MSILIDSAVIAYKSPIVIGKQTPRRAIVAKTNGKHQATTPHINHT